MPPRPYEPAEWPVIVFPATLILFIALVSWLGSRPHREWVERCEAAGYHVVSSSKAHFCVDAEGRIKENI